MTATANTVRCSNHKTEQKPRTKFGTENTGLKNWKPQSESLKIGMGNTQLVPHLCLLFWTFLTSFHSFHSFLPSFLPPFLPPFLPFFLPSFLSFFLPSSFLSFFLPSFVASFLPSFLPLFLSSFLPLFLSSFLPSFCNPRNRKRGKNPETEAEKIPQKNGIPFGNVCSYWATSINAKRYCFF